MLNPNQFQVNETWISFQINDAPVATGTDGDYNLLALMDAASCFILDIGFVPTDAAEIAQAEAERLLDAAYAHKREFAGELVIPAGQRATVLTAAATKRGITVTRLPEQELRLLFDEARQSFSQHISGDRIQ